MTLTNPTLIVTFSIMFTAVGLHKAGTPLNIIVCLLGVLIGSIAFWVIVGLWFKMIRDRSNQKTLRIIDYVSGVVIAISGILLVGVALVGIFFGRNLM
jgi:threonine/homoserine/homoserine lactone efflux protein